jgi:hypothetical protein
MADPHMDPLEQQIASIKTVFEGLMKQTGENNKALAKLSKGAKNSEENSMFKTHDKQSHGSFNSTMPKLAKLDFPRYNRLDDPTS